MESISPTSPFLLALERVTANLPKGFENIVERLRDLKGAAGKPSFRTRSFAEMLRGAWNAHLTACSTNSYPAKVAAIDHYLTFVKGGSPPAQSEAVLNALKAQHVVDDTDDIDDVLLDMTDRDRLVELQKHCDRTTLNSISSELESLSTANPDFEALERITAKLPQGFDDLAEELRELKEAATEQKRDQEAATVKAKQVQQKVLDFYQSVAILRALHNHQRQTFDTLLSKLCN
jgi:hypothetical protein